MKYDCIFCGYKTEDRKAWYMHKNGKKTQIKRNRIKGTK